MTDLTRGACSADPSPRTAATTYLTWDWPVTLRHNQIWLDLRHEAVALIIPTLLATDVTRILHQRRCPTPVLAHPYVPEHRVLAGEHFGVALPWPPTALRLSREIDLLGALHTALANGASPQPDEACRGRFGGLGAPVGGVETVTGGPVRCMNRSKR
ncbi:MAG: hypothetical protein ACRDTE_15555, partial [Pseudonocardiaceae bacterium]